MGSHPAPPAPSRTALSPFATLDPAVLAALPATTPITVRSAALSAPHLLYLGTGGGKLLLFSLQTPSAPEFLRLVPTGATRPVSAILPLPSVSRVLLLADGALLLADPLLARPVRRLGSLRNVAAVAASSTSPSSCSLAVAVGKKLLVIDLTLREADELEVQTREIAAGPAVDAISVLAWVGEDSVFAGAASGYSLFSTGGGGTGQSVDIFALPESAGSPRIRPLSGGEEVMLLVDNVGVVVDRFGHPSGSSFVFNSRPDCIAEVFPYVVVAGESKLDVYRRRNGAHLQSVTIESSRAGVLTVASDDKVVVVATAYKVK
jgi:hypothetical protein